DRLLYRSNLDGYLFHVRTLARECNMNPSTVSRTLSRWPFLKRKGFTKGSTIEFDYQGCLNWIVAVSNNHCCIKQPTSTPEKVHVPDMTLMHTATKQNGTGSTESTGVPVPAEGGSFGPGESQAAEGSPDVILGKDGSSRPKGVPDSGDMEKRKPIVALSNNT